MSLWAVFKHRYTGYFLEGLKFGVLLFMAFQVGDRIYTLETSGCTGYHSSFSGVGDFSNVKMFSEQGYQEFVDRRSGNVSVPGGERIDLNDSWKNLGYGKN